jgi:hypothetical protein
VRCNNGQIQDYYEYDASKSYYQGNSYNAWVCWWKFDATGGTLPYTYTASFVGPSQGYTLTNSGNGYFNIGPDRNKWVDIEFKVTDAEGHSSTSKNRIRMWW